MIPCEFWVNGKPSNNTWMQVTCRRCKPGKAKRGRIVFGRRRVRENGRRPPPAQGCPASAGERWVCAAGAQCSTTGSRIVPGARRSDNNCAEATGARGAGMSCIPRAGAQSKHRFPCAVRRHNYFQLAAKFARKGHSIEQSVGGKGAGPLV